MTAFDRLKLLCAKQGISVNDLEERSELVKTHCILEKEHTQGHKFIKSC